MRILVVTTTFPSRDDDGSPAFVADLAGQLGARAEVTVVAPRTGDRPSGSPAGVQVVRVPYWPRRWERVADGAVLENIRQRPWLVVQLIALCVAMTYRGCRLAARQRPDVVHAHWLLPGGLIGYVIARTSSAPLICTIHGVDLHALRTLPVEAVRRWMVKRSDRLFPVSRELAARLHDLGASDDLLTVIPMGASPAFSGETDAAGQLRPPDRLLFVGRLAAKKGLGTLLRAVAAAPGPRVTIAGDGPDRSSVERMVAELDLGARVELLGPTPRARVAELMRSSTALVVPSVIAQSGDREGMPVVIAEALACGLPVIASRVGGIPDVLTDRVDAILVDPGDADQLASAIREVFADEALRALLASNGGSTAASLTMEETARRYEDALTDLLQDVERRRGARARRHRR